MVNEIEVAGIKTPVRFLGNLVGELSQLGNMTFCLSSPSSSLLPEVWLLGWSCSSHVEPCINLENKPVTKNVEHKARRSRVGLPPYY